MLTVYADLLQQVETPADETATSISIKTVRGKRYAYRIERRGVARGENYLGPIGDPEVLTKVEKIRREADLARARRKSVQMLIKAGLPAPTTEVARILDVVSRAGLFELGFVLVGSLAFQHYPALVGHTLPAQSMMTADADFVATTVGLSIPGFPDPDAADLLSILRQADPTFTGIPTLDRSAMPSQFRNGNGLLVDLLTPVRTRKDQEGLVPLPGLAASAVPLHYLEYLVADAVPAVVLRGSGIRIRIPQPAHFAIHKLIVAAERPPGSAKVLKDLAQAKSLIDALDVVDPDALAQAREDAEGRGPKWRRAISSSLRKLGL